MIKAPVPKDIRNYRTKIIGPFTMRQLICICVAALLDVCFFMYVYPLVSVPFQTMIYILVFLNLPVLIFMVDMNGMPMEKYLGKVLIKYMTTPAGRKIRNKIISDPVPMVNEDEMTEKELREHRRKLKTFLKEHPEYTGQE